MFCMQDIGFTYGSADCPAKLCVRAIERGEGTDQANDGQEPRCHSPLQASTLSFAFSVKMSPGDLKTERAD